MSFAFLGVDFKPAELHFRKAKLIFDLGKHTLNLATTRKDIQSAGDVLSRAKQQLDQAWTSLKETAVGINLDDFPDALLKQLTDLSIDMADENNKYFSKMMSMDGLGLDDWRKTLASKKASASLRKWERNNSFHSRLMTYLRSRRESVTPYDPYFVQTVPIPEEDPIKSFRESIQRALDSARQGQSNAASAHLERALIQSKTFQNPEFTNTVLAMTQWFIDKRSEKTLVEKIRSIHDDVSNAMTSIQNDRPLDAVHYSNRAEQLLKTIPASFSGPLKRLVSGAQRLSHDAVEEARNEMFVQTIDELQAKWRGILPEAEVKKLSRIKEALHTRLIALKTRLQSGRKLPADDLVKIKRGFKFEEMLQRVDRNLTKAEALLPIDDFEAAKIIRRSQNQLQLALKQVPMLDWEAKEEFLPGYPTMTQKGLLEKSAKANYEKTIAQVRNLANRILKLSMQSKTIRREFPASELMI